jgi:hypothetical protein
LFPHYGKEVADTGRSPEEIEADLQETTGMAGATDGRDRDTEEAPRFQRGGDRVRPSDRARS